MTAAPIAVGREYECSLRGANVSAHCTAPTSRKPTTKRCPGCGAEFVVRVGTYAVVPWRGDGRYSLDQAVATRASRPAAWALAQKSGPQYVERFLPV